MADELLAGDRMLPLGKPLEVIFPNLPDDAPAIREFAIPHAANDIGFGVVVLARVLKFFLVVPPRLARTQWLGDREHEAPLLEEWLLCDGRGCRPLLGDDRLGHGRLDDGRGRPLGWHGRDCWTRRFRTGRSTNAGCRAGRSMNGKCSRTTRFPSFK